MTVGEFLVLGTGQFAEAGIETARLDCLILLEDALKIGRPSLLAHPETELRSEQLAHLSRQIKQRAGHTPLAYIRGHAPFYGRDFVVDKHVLVPRPETETIITLFKNLPLPVGARVADIGTGSGCIAITAALESPSAVVAGCDISAQALKIASQNATQLNASIQFYKSDLLANLRDNYDVLLANLPYVPEHFPVNQAATHEPKLALFSGADGLDAYRIFWQQAAGLTHKPQFILTESLPAQHHVLAQIARANGYAIEKRDDFVQVFSLL